ncbi:hypothetical protein GE300_15855 [Rhodobacteraceae bacterium 2CG4]|uniref:Lipoprotein n=1 Tax=Halovulum marinum TaxID=2662447 RepID=A0A6L5Z4V5_9RHOB|nr:hypothetical protein [Halovulum marinum]MSU91064.1 hypothetical protein [Halovulum marinum]
MRVIVKPALAATLLALAACGNSFEEQALIGAGAGAATAAVLDESVAAGALVGAAGNVAYCNAYPSQCR